MKITKTLIVLTIVSICACTCFAQTILTNVPGRKNISLNGKWNYIIDPLDAGNETWISLWKDKKPVGKTDFYEYSFDKSATMNVPGDFNSQLPELKYYEGTVWYKRFFKYEKQSNRKVFLCFGGVNYKAEVFFNGERLGKHEGGFTAFQFDVTNLIKDGENAVLVYANNLRVKDGIPSLSYDWRNYGGITRDVTLVETPETYINDYFVQLKKGSKTEIAGWIQLGGKQLKQKVRVQIAAAGIDYKTITDDSGFVAISFPTMKLQLWNPAFPKLYEVRILGETDTISENIGFRNIEVKGADIVLNGEKIFLKGVNIHEEIPQREARAHSEADARVLLGWAKELGCNFVRLAHYPHNENMLRMADQMGLMVWSEIPVFQGISFGNPQTNEKIIAVVNDMIARDKNRCGIIMWSVANETSSNRERNKALFNAINECRRLDPTRLVTAAVNNMRYEKTTVTINDTLFHSLDVVGVNEYLGWYHDWVVKPEEKTWVSRFNKPIIVSEFGGEALYGNHGSADTASSWSEEHQEKVYMDQIKMFKNMSLLRGTCAWILADFRSPKRMHQAYQNGWNRKGLISDQGYRKKAWYVLAEYYKGK